MIPQPSNDPARDDPQPAAPNNELRPRLPVFSGTGRTSLLRGCIALVVAPAFAVIPLSLLFFAVDIGGQWEENRQITRNLSGVLPLVAVAYAMVAGVTAVFGGVTWIVLRAFRRESARAYALAGAVGGLLCAFRVGYSGSGELRLDQMLAFALLSATGCVIALGFWFIARDRRAPANAMAADPLFCATGSVAERLNKNSDLPRAGLGETIPEAQAGGFFGWFHLAPVDDLAPIEDNAQEVAGLTWHRFRPSGSSFNALVELAVGVGSDERIAAACLGIDRAFIANARNRPFARDIAKSFLNWILPQEAGIALAADVEAISQYCDGESVVITRSSADSSSRPTSGGPRASGGMADVFIGSAARAEQTVGSTRIMSENLMEPLPRGVSSRRTETLRAVPDNDQEAWLRIAVG
jgi:hypothetical protein